MSQSCLVTGGAGFIGSSIVRALLARGDRVRVIDNFFSGKRENLTEVAGDIELIEGDVRVEADLQRALAGVELVFHQAAIPSVPRSLVDPIASHEANATATLKLLHAAKAAGVRRVVYAASSSAYGDTPTLPKIETMRPAPLSPYAVSKLAGEHYCQVFAGAYGLETVCLRYFNVFGPRQDPEVGVRGGDPALRDRRPDRQGRHHLRRRHAVARLLLHREHRRGQPGGGAAPGGRRVGAGVQRRLRRGDHAQRRGQAARRAAGQAHRDHLLPGRASAT